jgi:hypothetical protein
MENQPGRESTVFKILGRRLCDSRSIVSRFFCKKKKMTDNNQFKQISLSYRTIAYEYSLSYVRTLPSNSSLAQSAAIDLVATALRLPTLFDFDSLFKLDAVIALKDHEIFSLLQVFLSGGLSELDQWRASHAGVAEKYSNATDLSSTPIC